MSFPGALPQTLRSITSTKIRELSKQRALFERRSNEIMKAAAAVPELLSKAQILLEGVTKLKGHPNDAFDREDLDLDRPANFESRVEDGTERSVHVNIRRFLLQGKYDRSVSESSLKGWIAQLEQELRYMKQSHDHAYFYSRLVTEWLEDLENKATSFPSSPTTESESFDLEPVGRSEMQEQRQEWESFAFNAANLDEDAIRSYLDGLFKRTPLSEQALKELRETIKLFGTSLSAKTSWFRVDDLEWVSKSLLKTDLLTKEKTAILKEFTRNRAVAQEVVDVLNMRLASLESWAWPDEGIPMEMRLQLNGKYRVYMDEDLLDSLMFHYLGLKWAVVFRSAFEEFLESPGWKKVRENITEQEKLRRQYFLGSASGQGSDSVNDYRLRNYRDDYFMTQLPSSVEEDALSYGDEGHDNFEKTRKNALDTKHSLLHTLLTESIIHTTLHGQFTAIRSDFKWFGPSLPHSTILTVLSYFGVPQDWLNFFRTFLEAPLKFTQDGPNATVSVRKRGIPMSHSLSDAFGEVVLFCMDYAVNQSTDGAYLYRMHDDFWFWGQENTCVKAWSTMTEFATVMGLEFNEEKTGTVRLDGGGKKFAQAQAPGGLPSSETEGMEVSGLDKSTLLPPGDLRWGFLKLDSQQHRFIIDQEMVESHTSELRRQLSSCKSVFAWMQAWNTYFGRFFGNNFAKAAMCFGREHIDMAISTLSHIERSLFPDGELGNHSGVTDHLRKMIADRFGVDDLPEGLFYFPIELGGLSLLNPYIPLLAMRENIKQTPRRRVQKAFLEIEAQYQKAKEDFDEYGPPSPGASFKGLRDYGIDSEEFMSLEEYMQHSESYSRPLLRAYQDLVRVPAEASANLTPEMRGYQVLLGKDIFAISKNSKSISSNWNEMSPYWRWTAELYQSGMVKKYGSLAAVNREFMPVGVVATLKEGRFRWQG